MKKKIIIMGTDDDGRRVARALKEKYSIYCFIESSSKKANTLGSIHGIPVYSPLFFLDPGCRVNSIIICKDGYADEADVLIQAGILDYYVFLKGFLYHTSTNETMMPVELNRESPLIKKDDRDEILFVIDEITQQLLSMVDKARKNGNGVHLLHQFSMELSDLDDLFDSVNCFTTVNGIRSFIDKSEFDIIYCSDNSSILKSICRLSSKPIRPIERSDKIVQWNTRTEAFILEYLNSL